MTPQTRAEGPVALVGRARECARVDEALHDAAAGERRVLMVGGDAGIGKTTLVDYATWRAAALGLQVLEGGCLDLSTKVPFGPVLEAVRPLLREKPNPVRRPATALVREMTGAAGDPEQLPKGEVLGVLREVVAEAARDAPLLFVLEDMHWSEASTRDFALSLARAGSSRVALMVTYRADEIERGHPFRPTLNDLARTSGCVRIDLAALDRAGLAELVERRTGEPADPAYVWTLLARSEGNPLFVEELLAAGRNTEGVPPLLAELFLARIDALPDPVRKLLRAASVDGTRINADLLTTVSGSKLHHVEAGLRAASDANLLTQRSGRLEFRHALLTEAIYGDLLPGERSRLHRRYAEALQELGEDAGRDVLARTARLAHHWQETGELSRTLKALVSAGEFAAHAYGPAEAVAYFEQVLDLWDQVPDPGSAAGMALADVHRLVSQGYGLVDRSKAIAHSRAAVAALGPHPDRLLAARVYTGQAAFVDDPIPDGMSDAADKALEYAYGTDSKELAGALSAKADQLCRDGHCYEALALATRSREVARTVGETDAEVEAVLTLFFAQLDCGYFAEALSTYRDMMDPSQPPFGRLESGIYQPSWELVGGHAQTALELARQRARTARELGLTNLECAYAGAEADVLIWTGELGGAQRLLDEMVARGLSSRWLHARIADLRIAQGDFQEAFYAEEQYIALRMQNRSSTRANNDDEPERHVALLCGLQDAPRALVIADAFVRAATSGESPTCKASACLIGLKALVSARHVDVPAPPDLADVVDATMAELDATDCAGWMNTANWARLQTAHAYRPRLAGRPDPCAWETAVDSWRKIGFAYNAVAESVHLAEDLLDTGERDQAVEVVTDEWHKATAMGARGIAADFGRLARRLHLHLDESKPSRPPALRSLTPRELEVLDLVATGATNRDIAKQLFISEKTVSVHVSNLMAKLGVAHRDEAAALAVEQREPT